MHVVKEEYKKYLLGHSSFLVQSMLKNLTLKVSSKIIIQRKKTRLDISFE